MGSREALHGFAGASDRSSLEGGWPGTGVQVAPVGIVGYAAHQKPSWGAGGSNTLAKMYDLLPGT